MAIVQRYLDADGEVYHKARSRGRLLSPHGRKVRAVMIREILAPWLPVPCRRILEFGGGFGQNLLQLPVAQRLVYEPSAYAQRLVRTYPELRLVLDLADVERDSCDAILAYHSLEHVPDPLSALRSLRSMLTPTGRLIVVVPFEQDRSFASDNVDYHLYSWTPQTLGNLCTEAGFAVQHAARFGQTYEYRLAPLRYVGLSVWLGAVRLCGHLMRREQVLVVAAASQLNASGASS